MLAGAHGDPLSSGRCPEGAGPNPKVGQEPCSNARCRVRLAHQQRRC